MSDYSDAIDALSPDVYWRFGESSGNFADSSGGGHTLNAYGTPDYGETGAIDGDANTAARFNRPTYDSDYCRSALGMNLFAGATQFSFNFWVLFDVDSGYIFHHEQDATRTLRIEVSAGTKLRIFANINAVTINLETSAHDFSAWTMVTITFDAGDTEIYINGVADVTATGGPAALFNSTQYMYVARGVSFAHYFGSLDEFSAFSGTLLSPAQITELYGLATGIYPPDSLPMALAGFLSAPVASLPMRLNTVEPSGVASLALALEAGDPAHYLGSAAVWAPLVVLDGVDISTKLVARIELEHAENESGEARFTFIPDTGPIDLGDYERKPVAISFVGKSAAGATLYTVRRFTGITATATLDPDAGELIVTATTDLQGRLENLTRAQLTQLIGGQWSAHVFDDTADGYAYALDRLSTLPKAINVDVYGRLVLDDWAAKVSADVTLTDGERFGDSLALARASRRDLITRVQINIDFRFSRLRHRELDVVFLDALGFCHYLNNGWRAPGKDMIRAAADGTAWTRQGAITFTELPGTLASVCSPPRAWAGGADLFCLGASWRAARRWAQSLTEEYSLTVHAPDLESALGVQLINADYGLEATYDATDYEALTDFAGPPDGAAYDSALGDWVLAADDTEFDGRLALEAAQECALAQASVEILGRARKNRVRLDNVYDPSLTLDKTVRVNTPYLIAKGKLARIIETLDLTSGEPRQRLELALSRHGGAGLASDDPLTAPSAPSAPAETPTDRTYYLPYRLGALEFSAPDDSEWDGYMVDVAAGSPIYDAAGESYRNRFVVRMPPIEEAARDAVSVQSPVSFELAVPQDELTVSN